jgi:hypothetical protein
MHRGEVGITLLPLSVLFKLSCPCLKKPNKTGGAQRLQSFNQNKLKNYQSVQNNQKIFLRTAWQSTPPQRGHLSEYSGTGRSQNFS